MKKTCALLLLLLAPLSLFASIDDYRLHLKITEMEEARKPEVYFDQIIFTYESAEPVRHVGIAFAHENFREIHTYQRNGKGVFFFLLSWPYVEHIDYRLIVDGIWMTDPACPTVIPGSNGVELTRFTVGRERADEKISPQLEEDNQVTCRYWGDEGETVYLAGDFNNWDPYMFPMKESSPGLYEISLFLSGGTYHYCYYVNGESSTDPLNERVAINLFGEEVSRLDVP
ncbi:MAG: glycoside hydrolase [Spirochaetales bacterium]|nr:glycoside hydrolase [Spirochaetales bacterium]